LMKRLVPPFGSKPVAGLLLALSSALADLHRERNNYAHAFAGDVNSRGRQRASAGRESHSGRSKRKRYADTGRHGRRRTIAPTPGSAEVPCEFAAAQKQQSTRVNKKEGTEVPSESHGTPDGPAIQDQNTWRMPRSKARL